MSVYVQVVLIIHEAFIDYSAVHILIEAIINEVSRDGRNVKDFLVPIEVSRFFDILD